MKFSNNGRSSWGGCLSKMVQAHPSDIHAAESLILAVRGQL